MFDPIPHDILGKIRGIFPALQAEHFELLEQSTIQLINVIKYKFRMTHIAETYFVQLRLNDYQDLKALILLLLPFLDEDTRPKGKKIRDQLTNLNELYVKQVDGTDVSACNENTFDYTNVQFNRAGIDRRQTPNTVTMDHFDITHFKHNLMLLFDTIQRCSHTMFVNWMTVRPLLPSELATKPIYVQTKEHFDRQTVPHWDTYAVVEDDAYRSAMTYQGLYIGDIYNWLVNFGYVQVKKFKWLLFENEFLGTNMNYLMILSRFFSMQPVIECVDWNALTLSEQTKWMTELDRFMNHNGLDDVKKVILLFYISKYSNKLQLFNKSENKSLLERVKRELNVDIVSATDKIANNDNDLNDDYNQNVTLLQLFQQLPLNELITLVRNGDSHMFYSYLVEVMSQFRYTWYYEKMVHTNPDGTITFPTYHPILTLKNIYHLAKSLGHMQVSVTKADGTRINEYIFLGTDFTTLIAENKAVIVERIKQIRANNFRGWYNIRGYLRRMNLLSQYDTITEALSNQFVDIIFDIGTRFGILSEYVPNILISDEQMVPRNASDKKAYFTEQMRTVMGPEFAKYKDAFYFLTLQTYGELMPYRHVDLKTGDVLEEMPYLASIGRGMNAPWYSFYAMDWIAQIGFFHHYINNRVMFVTGATGTGKSTQVPKLLLYAELAINHRLGRAICTQPRISPTTANAIQIASQMGVQIEEFSRTLRQTVATPNFYLQYKYQGGSHISPHVPMFLRMVTDGTLIMELYNNLILKRKWGNGNMTDANNNYFDENLYDLVIIDEAHEHNTNMDLILTLMRATLLMNNQIKLVIVSATMAEDEPLLRRYYRDINDNWMYPFNRVLQEMGIDRMNVDRRYHISAPDKTTQYVVDEYYDETSTDIVEENIQRSYARVMQILEQTRGDERSDILLFSLGQKEINDAYTYLVEATAAFPHCAILPFFSAMSSKWKTLVEEIAKRKVELDIPKDKIFDVFSTGNEDGIQRVPKGTYKQVVIIATNVAEASITIDTLKYVVDIGYYRTEEFNMFDLLTSLRVEQISESSRLQRKGRVGRTACGVVYHTYKKDSRKKVIPRYKITQSDITSALQSMIAENDKRIYEIFTVLYKILDGRMITTDATTGLPVYISGTQMVEIINQELSHFGSSPFVSLFKALWFYDEKIILTHPNHKIFISHYSSMPHIVSRATDPLGIPLQLLNGTLEGGFTTELLNDYTGEFYYIHPTENYIVRDMLTGQIRGIINESNNAMIVCVNPTTTVDLLKDFENIPKVAHLLILMEQFYLCIPKVDSRTNKRLYVKTKLGKYLQAILKQLGHLNMAPHLVNQFLIMRFRNDPFFMSDVLPLMLIMDNPDLNDPYQWLSNYRNVSFIVNHMDQTSEIYSLYQMLRKIFNEFAYFNVFREQASITPNELSDLFVKDYVEHRQLTQTIVTQSTSDPRLRFVDLPSTVKLKQFEYFQRVASKPEDDMTNQVLEYTSKFYMPNRLTEDIERNKQHIARFCQVNGLKEEKIHMILHKQAELCEFFRRATVMDTTTAKLRLGTFVEPNPRTRIIRYFLTGHFMSLAIRTHTDTNSFYGFTFSTKRKMYGNQLVYGYNMAQSLLMNKGRNTTGIVFAPYHLKRMDKNSVINLRFITWVTPQQLVQVAPHYFRPSMCSRKLVAQINRNEQYSFYSEMFNFFSPSNFEEHIQYFLNNPEFQDIIDYFNTIRNFEIQYINENRKVLVQTGGGKSEDENIPIDEFMRGDYPKSDKFKVLMNINNGDRVVVNNHTLVGMFNSITQTMFNF